MPFARGANYQPQDYETRRMWEDGPSRLWSRTRGKIPYATGGFVGSYLCQGCNQQADGVYRSEGSRGRRKWLCAGCADRNEKATRDS
jgi:hypothetical protein